MILAIALFVLAFMNTWTLATIAYSTKRVQFSTVVWVIAEIIVMTLAGVALL